MLVSLNADEERGDVHEAAADTDVTLTNDGAGVVDRGGSAVLEDTGLETAVKELLNGKREEGIELDVGVLDDAVAGEATEEGTTFEETLGGLQM